MKQLTVISGKGGTGKTTLVGAFAALAKDMVLADCDVDAPDLHLILKPEVKRTDDFTGLGVATINKKKCAKCGKCAEYCRFDAIHGFKIDPIKCEGCGVCTVVCPADAITLKDKIAGQAFISDTRFGSMCHAKLNVGEEASGKLVMMVRNNAREIAEKENKKLIIIDGPPGIGCPVIASLTGTDLALIVSEPTVSGIHDLKRILAVTRHFGVKALVCINKYDINVHRTAEIESFCRDDGIIVVGRIPYDPLVTRAMVNGRTVTEFTENGISDVIKDVWDETLRHL